MLLPTGPDHLFAWLSVVKAGAVAAPIHTDLAPEEVAGVLEHLEPAALIYSAALAPKLSSSLQHVRRIGLRIAAGAENASLMPPPAAPLAQILSSRRPLTRAPDPAPDDIAEILTTSGTTGKPKAAMIPHRMPVITGEAFAHWLGLTRDDRLFTCLPYSHINARHYSTMGALAAGASLALEERFSASRFWKWIGETGATQFNAIGAMINILQGQPEHPEERGHRVRLAYAAPALGADRHLAFERRFGVRLAIGYGLTESTFGFIHPLSDERDLESMGKPRRHPDPSLEAAVRLVPAGPASGSEARRDAPIGEAGEIWLRNPAIFAGYFKDPGQTEATIVDGWLRTGDLARRDGSDNYFFVGRLKQVIRRRGENIAPVQVEAVLEEHPAVAEAAVIGVPSPLGEDEVCAFVVLRAGARATHEELTEFCAGRLAAFKVPSRWRFIEVLPRTPTQRIAYHLLPRD